MRQATQVQLIERAIDHISRRTPEMSSHITRQPVGDFLDAARFERERAVLFRSHPLLLTPSAGLAHSGDYLSTELCGLPVALTRDQSSQAAAFLNVCRHRGCQLLEPGTGALNGHIVCPYHAWTYGLDGRLVAIPHPAGFPDVALDEHRLVALPTEERHGFVWGQLDPAGQLDLGCYLAELGDELDSYGFSEFTVYSHEESLRELNWKLVIEIYLEAYHFFWLHRNSTLPIFFDNIALADFFGPHMRFITPKRSILQLADQDQAKWNLRPHATILYLLFPNTLLFVEAHHASLIRVFPETIDRSRLWTTHIVSRSGDRPRLRRFWEANIKVFMSAVREDLAIGESIQKGLRSGANAHLTYGRFERSLGIFHESVEARLASD